SDRRRHHFTASGMSHDDEPALVEPLARSRVHQDEPQLLPIHEVEAVVTLQNPGEAMLLDELRDFGRTSLRCRRFLPLLVELLIACNLRGLRLTTLRRPRIRGRAVS